MLDRLKAFTGRQFDSGGGDVVLQVDELLRSPRGVLFVRHLEQRQGRFFETRQGFGQGRFDRTETGFAGRAHATFKTIGQGITKAIDAIDTADTYTFLRSFARYETEDVFTPDRLAAQVRCQVHHRAVAAGAGDDVTVEPFARAGDFMSLHIDRGHTGCGHTLGATSFDHGAASEDTDTFGARFFNQRTTRIAAGVSDGDHLQAGVEPVQCHAVGVIVVGRQHQFLARCHAITTHVSRDSASQHVARHVVVAVDQWTLMSAGREYDALGANTVDALTHLANRCAVAEVIGEALVNGQEVVIVVTVDRGARQQQHVRGVLQLGDNAGDPFHGRFAVEAFAGVEQAATELFLFVRQDHPGTAARSSQGCRQTSRAGADDQHVTVLVHVVVGVRIVLGRRAAKTGGLTNVFLVRHPERLRVHEGFVVETRWHQLAADLAENPHHVVVHAWPAVGAGGDQTLIQRLLRGAYVGNLCGFGGADLQNRVRLFGTGGEDAARTGILEAATDDVDAVGQQCSGQRIAFKAFVALAVEGEAQHFVAVDPSAVGQAIDLAHTFSPRAVLAAFGLSVLSVNCGLVPIL